MKKLIVLLLAFSGTAFAVGDKAASGWSVKNVAVSTKTVTAIPTTALTGRYKIFLENMDSTFGLYIGSSTAMTTADGYFVQKGSTTVELPLPQGLTVYGIGESNESTGTIVVRIIEVK